MTFFVVIILNIQATLPMTRILPSLKIFTSQFLGGALAHSYPSKLSPIFFSSRPEVHVHPVHPHGYDHGRIKTNVDMPPSIETCKH